jgi:hypothetical protein
MAPILTAEDVVRRIATECTYVDERGGVGIRLRPAAAIVRQYGEQFRRLPRRSQTRRSPKPPPLARFPGGSYRGCLNPFHGNPRGRRSYRYIGLRRASLHGSGR